MSIAATLAAPLVMNLATSVAGQAGNVLGAFGNSFGKTVENNALRAGEKFANLIDTGFQKMCSLGQCSEQKPCSYSGGASKSCQF